jgi:hypothetical protein
VEFIESGTEHVQSLHYDVAVLDIGSATQRQSLLTDEMLHHLLYNVEDKIPRLAFSTHPVSQIVSKLASYERALVEHVEQRRLSGLRLPVLHVVTVGSGNNSFEMAFALNVRMLAKFSPYFEKIAFKIVHSEANAALPSVLVEECKRRDIELIDLTQVIEIERSGNLVVLRDPSSSSASAAASKSASKRVSAVRDRSSSVANSSSAAQRSRSMSDANVPPKRIPFHVLCWSTGAAPQMLNACSGLSLANDGFIRVNEYLQAIDFPNVFAAGDCATLDAHRETPKNGVMAEVQGPTLARNVLHALKGVGKMEKFAPQSKYSSVIMTGDGKAIAQRRWLPAMHNKMMWKMRDYKDRKWIRRFQAIIQTGERIAEEEADTEEALEKKMAESEVEEQNNSSDVVEKTGGLNLGGETAAADKDEANSEVVSNGSDGSSAMNASEGEQQSKPSEATLQ